MYDSIVIHYGEIGVKGKNRFVFENKLISNVEKVLSEHVEKTYKRYGKIVCDLKPNQNLDEIKNRLKLIPGIVYFAFAVKSKLAVDVIEKVSEKILKSETFKTFRVSSKRSNKNFELNSKKLNEVLGASIEKLFGSKVKLDKYDLELNVEIGEKEAFVYTKKYKGAGGLPVGTAGVLVSSLSGGIDSPVASYLMMRRGCEVVFVHTFNRTMTKEAVLSKLEELAKQLTKVQIKSKLYIVPFERIQKEIIMNVPSDCRMIVYRRFMMKIANEIAKKEKANGIVTGDNVGQVASQTTNNIACIYEASELPVLPPLIGANKEEIINIAKDIGTYEISIQPYPDCCSYMIAKHPATKANISKIKKFESNINDADKLISESIENAEIKVFKL